MNLEFSLGSESQGESWVRRVILLSWFTIIYNVAEGIVSIAFGVAEDSIALAGFGADSLIEVASAVFVLWRFRSETGKGEGLAIERECFATRAIGVLFLLLALLTGGTSVSNLFQGFHPVSTLPGVVISCLSLSFMFYLWRSKKTAAQALNSRTVAQDAACSLACIQLSLVLLLGSGVYALFPAWGWLDSIAALVISAFIGREGIKAIRSANREEFSGGCCGCD